MRLVIIGAGFAGMYAALSAARLRDIQGASPEQLEIALVAPEPTLVVRPRLYESKPETLTAPLQDVLKAIDVVYVQGSAGTIDTKSRVIELVTAKGTKQPLSYDRLVVATGSRLFRPNIPGIAEHYEALRTSQVLAARAIVRRGIDRGELPGSIPITLLLDTLVGGAMMHAMTTPAGKRAALAGDTATHAGRLVDFLLHSVTAGRA